MSLGFSLADFKLAYDLGKLIYDTCFTKANRAGRPFLSTLEYSPTFIRILRDSEDGAILLTMCDFV